MTELAEHRFWVVPKKIGPTLDFKILGSKLTDPVLEIENNWFDSQFHIRNRNDRPAKASKFFVFNFFLSFILQMRIEEIKKKLPIPQRIGLISSSTN